MRLLSVEDFLFFFFLIPLSIVGSICLLKSLIEEYGRSLNYLYMIIIDLEKNYDRVSIDKYNTW
jgi:hypothetical protein